MLSLAEKKEEVKQEDVVKPEVKKHAIQLWTSEEKRMFFEALNEFGKDFESIHLYITTKSRKKGITEDLIKTKHQVRHFYYKTFNMLFTCLKFSERESFFLKNCFFLLVLLQKSQKTHRSYIL